MIPPGGPTTSTTDWASVTAAVRAALSGRLIVVPTDTVYGIGTRPDDPEATALLFEAKGRARSLTLPVLVASLDQARSVAVFDDRAEGIAGRAWPGTITLVLPRTRTASRWALGDEGDTVGVRVPGHAMCRAVLDRTGPLAVTSANRSGEPTPRTLDPIRRIFGARVSVYLDGGTLTAGTASTVLDLAHGEPTVLRTGATDPAELTRLLDG
jgi:tRNA threonylcarbamoyl adenosine modification protein (Sua5/YciO/YrdC/YwlC family)